MLLKERTTECMNVERLLTAMLLRLPASKTREEPSWCSGCIKFLLRSRLERLQKP